MDRSKPFYPLATNKNVGSPKRKFEGVSFRKILNLRKKLQRS